MDCAQVQADPYEENDEDSYVENDPLPKWNATSRRSRLEESAYAP